MNWTKVAELARRLVTGSLTILTGEDPIAIAAADFLRSQSDLVVPELTVQSVLSEQYEVDSPKTCLLVLSRTGKAGLTADAVKAFRKKHPEARVLLLASRQSPVAGSCHCGITPPGVDDLTSVGPTADLILLWMTALIGDAVKSGAYLPACKLIDEKSVLTEIEKGLAFVVGRRWNKGVVWHSSQLGLATALASASARLSGCDWTAKLISENESPDPSSFHLVIGEVSSAALESFKSVAGFVVGGQPPDSPDWGSVAISADPSPSAFSLYQVGLDVCWLWSLWSGRNPDQYFTLDDKAQPEEQKLA